MHKLSGSCHCGNIHLQVALAAPPAHYHPRACDCDFCRKHGALYMADPAGSLVITLADVRHMGKYRQGSGLAVCLFCSGCGVLVAAVYHEAGSDFAAINCKALDGEIGFGEPQTVSPKALAPAEKIERWKKLWFADVVIRPAPL